MLYYCSSLFFSHTSNSDGYGLSGLGDVYLPASGTGGKARVGPQPGVTRHVQGFRVCEDPPVVVLDTPGVMAPHLEASPAGPAAAARLALAGCVADKAVEPDAMCAALLQELNSQGTLCSLLHYLHYYH